MQGTGATAGQVTQVQAGLQRLGSGRGASFWWDLIMSFGSFHRHILSPPASQVLLFVGRAGRGQIVNPQLLESVKTLYVFPASQGL